jgi:hypothetical protein
MVKGVFAACVPAELVGRDICSFSEINLVEGNLKPGARCPDRMSRRISS